MAGGYDRIRVPRTIDTFMMASSRLSKSMNDSDCCIFAQVGTKAGRYLHGSVTGLSCLWILPAS